MPGSTGPCSSFYMHHMDGPLMHGAPARGPPHRVMSSPAFHPKQEYVKLHQRYLVRGEDVLNEWHMEKVRRRTGSGITLLHGPYLKPPQEQVPGTVSPPSEPRSSGP